MSDPSGPDFDRRLFVQVRREGPSRALRERIQALGRAEIERARHDAPSSALPRRRALRATLLACAAGLAGLVWLCGRADEPIPISAESSRTSPSPSNPKQSSPAPEPPRNGEPGLPDLAPLPARSAATRPPVAQRTVAPRASTRAKPADAGTMAAAPAASPAPAAPARSLAEQIEQIKQARAALKAGQFGRTLELVDEYQSSPGGSEFSAEARLLRIEALAGAGRQEEAASEARRFVTDYPTSPLIDRVRSFLH
ncbi:MAG TPA: hypothetical protein VFS67_25140 [Polyangiaceae bacterium]|nr:hypothetical protein [Polyangiaceae bacterium]